MNHWYKKLRQYLKTNPGSGFVLAFMFLLVICVFLLIFKWEKMAEQIVIWAYLFLVMGIVLKLIRFLKERKN